MLYIKQIYVYLQKKTFFFHLNTENLWQRFFNEQSDY